MWLILIFLIFILPVIYMLFAPFYLEINSKIGLLRFRFHFLASARLLITNSSLIIDLRITGWRKQIDLLAQKRIKEKVIEIKHKTKPPKISLSKVTAIIRSFKINKCFFNLDLDNVHWNGILFPYFWALSKVTGKKIGINFLGKNEIELEIENNMARILWAFISN